MLFEAVKSELMKTDPVNSCISSVVSPNFVEPVREMFTTDLLVTLTFNSFALTAPETLRVPVKTIVDPSKVKLASALTVLELTDVNNLLSPEFV